VLKIHKRLAIFKNSFKKKIKFFKKMSKKFFCTKSNKSLAIFSPNGRGPPGVGIHFFSPKGRGPPGVGSPFFSPNGRGPPGVGSPSFSPNGRGSPGVASPFFLAAVS